MYYTHQKLIVWQPSIRLVDLIYDITDKFPQKEIFNLVSQMQRAAVSIPSNIAEGRARGSDKDFIHFLLIARGSVCELDTQLLICKKRNYINQENFEKACELCDEVNRKLTKLIMSIKAK